MESELTSKTKIVYNVFFSLLSAVLLFVCFHYSKSVSRVTMYLVLAVLALIIAKAFSGQALLRTLILEIALLPYDSLAIGKSDLAFKISGIKDAMQTVIAFSFTVSIFIPVIAMLIAVCVHNKKEIKAIKILIPAAIVIVCFIIGFFVPSLINHVRLFATYSCMVIVTDLAEGKLLKNKKISWESLVYAFLFIRILYDIYH